MAQIKFTSAGGLNADSTISENSYPLMYAATSTQRDFTNGTLITTDIDYSHEQGNPFYLEIKGNVYGRRYCCYTIVQGYIYSNTIINYGVTHLGGVGISQIVAMNISGNLCFWFPRQGYWEGYSIFASTAYDYRVNRITAISDVAEPDGTKKVTLTDYCLTNLNSGNYTSYCIPANIGALSLTGGTLTGHLKLSGTKNLSSPWDAGLIAGADGHDKVVASYLANNTSGATIGGHNSNLTGWAPLNISGTALYFRIEETTKMTLNSLGNLSLPGSVTASGGFVGNVTGNCSGSAGSLADDSAYVKHRFNNSAPYVDYTELGTYYNSGSTAKYIRIKLPVVTSWCMMTMEFTIRESYSSGYAGKLFVYGNYSSAAEWNSFKATVNGTLTSAIKVYGSDKQYIYVYGIASWGGLTLDKMTIGDSASSSDLSGIVIDGVSDLPATYQTATMYQTLTSGNYTSYCTPANIGAASSGHNHDGVYQPAGSYASASHNHDGVYQPAGSYASASHNHDSSYLKLSGGTITGNLTVNGTVTGSAVYGAVWNDLVDAIEVPENTEFEYGKCYCSDGTKYWKSKEYLEKGIIGIHSDTYGFKMGVKESKTLDVAASGFVLAYVDKIYETGTPLTCTENGYLTEILLEDKIKYPERIVATYWKSESSKTWGTEDRQVQVNGRSWVKIK